MVRNFAQCVVTESLSQPLSEPVFSATFKSAPKTPPHRILRGGCKIPEFVSEITGEDPLTARSP